MKHQNRTGARRISKNGSKRKLGAFLLLVPLVAAVATGYYAFGGSLMTAFASRGNARLTTDGWQSAQTSLNAQKPEYGTKFAYYKLQQGQTLAWAAKHFGVNLAMLQKLNPGTAVWGTTILVPPIEQAFTPFASKQSSAAGITFTQAKGAIVITNKFINTQAYVTIPQLMQITKSYNVISQLGPKTFVINKPLYVQGNIRVDITDVTVDRLYLRSSPNFDVTTLTFQNSEALFQNVHVSSLDPVTKGPDTKVQDGRSFLRAYESARMDMVNTTASYLGMTLDQLQDPAVAAEIPFVTQGGVYGVSWRIGTGKYGTDIATGWVQNSSFTHNHIGAFTFGASGMMWRSNLFASNEVYGLDPHDDSNNATIEYNRFVANGKHGFIVSKRCDYNVIRNNISIDNKLHGFMLHEDSNYNVIENNIAIGNHDNYVVYGSSYNSLANNRSYNPRGSNVRVNQLSVQNYITDNSFYGGKKGIYLYDDVNGVQISNNTFYNVTNQLTTDGAKRVLYASNQSNGLGYHLDSKDRVVFGVNTINKHQTIDLQPLQTINQGKLEGRDLTATATIALYQ